MPDKVRQGPRLRREGRAVQRVGFMLRRRSQSARADGHRMSPLHDLVHARREQVIAAAARHHGSRVRLFGSAADRSLRASTRLPITAGGPC